MVLNTTWLPILVTVFTSILASSGLWALISKKTDKNCNETTMLLGLAHDRIIYLGVRYIERGWITADEYENLHDYLYKPYVALNGNGSAERIMGAVKKLPISRSSNQFVNDQENGTAPNDYTT